MLLMLARLVSGRRALLSSQRLVSSLISLNLVLVLVLEIYALGVTAASKMANSEVLEDNEFAEFEELDEEDETGKKANAGSHRAEPIKPSKPPDVSVDDDNDAIVEEEEEEDNEDEFENVKDGEEFETVEGPEEGSKRAGGSPKKTGDLKFTKVPLHLRANWESYYLEFLMAAGLTVYFLNFVTGKNKNQKLANAWFDSHKELLEANFSLVGDDGKKDIETQGLMKETENCFTLWCSGRASLEGMLVELKFLKRQDLVSTISRLVKPASDQIIVKVHMNPDALDQFVFCVATKKSAVKLIKDMNDLSTFCPERKAPDKYGVSGDKFVLMNEIGEVASVLLDSKIVSLLKKYENAIDFIHISDQFSGPKLPEEAQLVKLPDVTKVMIFGFNCVDANGKASVDSMENMKPLMQMVFYLVEKVKRFRLSKEGKIKADKNRQKVEETFLKATHNQRQEAAQLKREERRRTEKERMLNEEDPDKQRKWEEKEHRRELKRKAPRMKQLKVKAL